jgi:hypothetical protein
LPGKTKIFTWLNKAILLFEKKIRILIFSWYFHGKVKICAWLNMATWPKIPYFFFANFFDVVTKPPLASKQS